VRRDCPQPRPHSPMHSQPTARLSLQGRHRPVIQHLEVGRGLPQSAAAPEAHRPAAAGSLLHRRNGPQTAPPGAIAPWTSRPAESSHTGASLASAPAHSNQSLLQTFCRESAYAMGVLNSEVRNGWLPHHLAI